MLMGIESAEPEVCTDTWPGETVATVSGLQQGTVMDMLGDHAGKAWMQFLCAALVRSLALRACSF